MPGYVLKTPLKTAEGVVPPGKTVELSEKDGEALVACEAAEAVKAGKTKANAKPADAVALTAAIAEAIGKLDKDKVENWTKGGVPQVGAIEAALGYEISAGERDAAWTAFQAEAAKTNKNTT